MNVSELITKIAELSSMIEREIPAGTPADAKAAAIGLIALQVVGELLVDVKRIADGAGGQQQHFHPPAGSVLSAIGEAVRIDPAPHPSSSASDFAKWQLQQLGAARGVAVGNWAPLTPAAIVTATKAVEDFVETSGQDTDWIVSVVVDALRQETKA